MKKSLIGFYAGIAALSILVIIFLATGSWERFISSEAKEETRTRVVTVRESSAQSETAYVQQAAWEENLNTKIPLEDAETVIAVLNKESEEGFSEEQFVVYLTSSAQNPVFITFLSFDERTRGYRRMWNAPVAATRADTITLFSQDLIGDRNNCIIVTGMNADNKHTMTIFRRGSGQAATAAYPKIAELQIDGSIIIQETTRSLAYQQGITNAQSFNIAAYGQDTASANILDQIETIFSYSSSSGRYEQTRVSRIPGSQIEQRRLAELLSGVPGVFENFINDLWYFISPQGTIDTQQYIYFDPVNREIIFYSDEAQQVFKWQVSTYTRYGLYIRSENISINTLLRFIEIELESLDSIRLRVNEDVRLRITANTTWDGSYRRAGIANVNETISQLRPAIDALYDSSWGRIQFNSSGEYSINSGANVRSGRYVFYRVQGSDLLELRPSEAAETRMVYTIENVAEVMILSRVRVGTNSIQDLLEPPITLTPVD
ncbi:MAG: pallilysin-related adhesin [Treponema sp.]|jgi:hypothetical protein|nr:pallilysin-related adhesin [Treponema sp.]